MSARREFKTKLQSPLFLAVITTLLLAVFLRWVLTTVIPVFAVETKYQYQSFLANVLHVSSLKELFMPPDFSGFDAMRVRSKHQDYGIKIPAIFIDEPVVFNVNPNDEKAYKEALKKGIAHASSTAFPDNAGIGYYFAHSSSADLHVQYNAVFYLLGKLEREDDIYIWHEGKSFKYKVTETIITEPDDVNFLNKEYDHETIVLQTCWPPGTTRQRFLVFAQRKD